jgi:hypothetical protein
MTINTQATRGNGIRRILNDFKLSLRLNPAIFQNFYFCRPPSFTSDLENVATAAKKTRTSQTLISAQN